MTIGPDGNVWFLDAGGNGSVDELNVSTGAVTRYALPVGLWLPPSGWRIAAGPNVASASGTGELFFTGTTANNGQGNAEIGEVSGIPFPVAPGSLAFKTAVTVSKQHVAVLTLICAGESNADCDGKIRLSVKAKVKVQVEAARTPNEGLLSDDHADQGAVAGQHQLQRARRPVEACACQALKRRLQPARDGRRTQVECDRDEHRDARHGHRHRADDDRPATAGKPKPKPRLRSGRRADPSARAYPRRRGSAGANWRRWSRVRWPRTSAAAT